MNKFYKKSLRILHYAKPYWREISFLFFISIILSALGLVSPYLIKILLDDVLIAKNYGMLFTLMMIFVVIFILNNITQVIYSYRATRLTEFIVLDVRKELFSHLEGLDLGFFNKRHIGDIIERLDSDVYGIEAFIDLIVNTILLNIISGIFILGICLHLSWKVTLASLAFFPFYVLTQRYFANKIKKKKKTIIQKDAKLLSFIQENIISISAIKAFVLEKLKLKEYVGKTKELINLALDMTLLTNYASIAIGVITFTALLIILWYGSYKVIAGAITVGTLMAIYTYITKLFGPVEVLGSINVEIQSTLVSVDRVFQFLDTKSKIKEIKNPIELIPKGNILFDKVNFNYIPKEPIIKDITFDIKENQSIGIVGPSGSGKSTIAKLLLRYYDPINGSIKIDGKDIKTVSLKTLRKNISVVSQETILFNTTIYNNIKLGNLNAKKEQIIEAAKLANIHKNIMEFDKGYNTIVGERGVRLSGGQKQRIAIARAIIKDPKILILDEATSSLDTESEEKIQDAINYVVQNRTTLIIAHRLSTLRNVDNILVIDDHKIKEKGNFSKLMKKKGEFYRFYNAQFGGIQQFHQTLMKEIDIAKKNKSMLNIISIHLQIENQKESFKLVNNVFSIIQQDLRKREVLTKIPHSQNTLYLLIPELNIKQLERRINDIYKKIMKKMPNLNIKFQVNNDIKQILNLMKE